MFNKTCRWMSWSILFISLFLNCGFAYGQETVLSYEESKLALLETNSLQNLIVNSVGPQRVTVEAPSSIQGQVLLAVYDQNSRFVKVVSVHSNGQSFVEFPFDETPLEVGSIVRAFYVGENWSPLAKTSGRVTIPETEEQDPNTQEMATDLKITIIGNPGSIRAANDNQIITFMVDGINPYVPPFNGINALVNVTLPNGKVVSAWQNGSNTFILQLDKGTSESTEDLIAGTYAVKVMTYQNPLEGETKISESNKTNQPERTAVTNFSIIDDTNELYVNCTIGGVSNRVPVASAQAVELTLYAPNGYTFKNVEYSLIGPLKNNLTSSNNGTLHEATYSETMKTVDVVGGGSITVSGLVTYDDGTTAIFEKSIQVSGYVVEFTPAGLLEVGSEVELRAVVTTNTGIPVNNAKVIWTSTDLNSTSNPMFKVFNNYSKTYDPSINSVFVDGAITNIQNGIYSKKVKLSEVGFLNCTVLNSLETVYAVNSQKVYGTEVYSLKNPVNSLIANQKNQTITLEPLDINGLPITPDWYYIDDNSAILSSVNAYMQTNKAHFSIVPCLKTGDFTILLGTDNGKKIVRIPISVVEPVVTVMVNGVESNKITAGLLEKVELYFENKAESTVTAVLSGLDGSIYQTDQITPLDAGQASVSGVNTIFTKVVPFKSFTEGFVDIYVDFNGSSIKATTLKVVQPTLMSFNSLEIGKQQEYQLYLQDANGNPLSGYCIKSLVNDANAGTLSSETDGNGNTLLSISPIAEGKISLQVPELLTKDANDLADNPNLSLISPNDLTPFSFDLPVKQYMPDTSGPDIQAADTYTISTIPTTIEILVTDVSRLGEVLIENQLADISSDGIVKLHIDELPFGEKAFSIQAKDLIGNESSKTVTVQYQNYPNNQVVTENLKITITGNPGSLRAASDPHLFTFMVDRIDSSVPVYIGTNMLLNVTLPNGRVVPATNVGIYQYPPQQVFTLQLDKGIDITTEDLIAGIYTVEAVTYLNPLEGESLISEANKTKQPVRKAITTFSIIDNTNVLFINGLTIGGFSGGNASKVPVGSSQVVGFTLVAPNGRTFKDVIYTVEGPLKATVTSRNLGALYGYMYGEATKTVDVIGGGIITFSGTVTYDNNSTEMFAKTLQVAGYIAEYSPAIMPAVSNEGELKTVVTTAAGIPINNARVVWTSTDFYGVSNPMFRLYNNVSKTYEPYAVSSVYADGAMTNIQNGVYSTKVKLNEVGVLTCSVMNNGAYGAIYAINSQPVYGEEVYTSNVTSASLTATKPNQELIIQLTDANNNSVKPDWIYVEDPAGISGYLPGSLQNVPTGTSMRFSPESKTGSFTILIGTDMGKKIAVIPVEVLVPKVTVKVNGIESNKITAGLLEKIEISFEDEDTCNTLIIGSKIEGGIYQSDGVTPILWSAQVASKGTMTLNTKVVPFKTSDNSKIILYASYGSGFIRVATLFVNQPNLVVDPTSVTVGTVVDLNLSLYDANGKAMNGYLITSVDSDVFAGNATATTGADGSATLTVSPNAIGTLTLKVPDLLTRDINDIQENPGLPGSYDATPFTTSISIQRDTQGPNIEMSAVYEIDSIPSAVSFKVTDISKVAEVWIGSERVLIRPDGSVVFSINDLRSGLTQYDVMAYDTYGNATMKTLIIKNNTIPMSTIQGKITHPINTNADLANFPITIYASGADLHRIDTSIAEGQTQADFAFTVPVGEYVLYYEAPVNTKYLSQGFYHSTGMKQLRDNAEHIQVSELGESNIDLTVISKVDMETVVRMPIDLPNSNEATVYTIFAVGEVTHSFEGVIPIGSSEQNFTMNLPAGRYVFYMIVNTGSDKLMPYSIYSTTGMKTQANQASLVEIRPGHLGLTFTLLTKPTISGLVSLPAGKFVQGVSDLSIKVSASTNNAALDLSALNTNSQVGPALQMVSSSNLVTTNVSIPLGSNAAEYTLTVAPGDYFVGYQIINQQSEFLGKGFYSHLGVTNAATWWKMIRDQENTFVSMQIPNAGFSDQNTYGVNRSMLEIQNDLVKAGVQDVSPSDWYAGSFTVLINNELISPDDQGLIQPNSSVTAAEGISIFAKTLGIADFNDTPSVAFSKTIQYGYVPSTVLENQMLTRIDLGRFLKLVLGMTSEPTSYTKSLFRDVSTLSEDDIGILNAVYESRLFVGFGRDNFRPSDVVTKAEIAVLVDRILSMFS